MRKKKQDRIMEKQGQNKKKVVKPKFKKPDKAEKKLQEREKKIAEYLLNNSEYIELLQKYEKVYRFGEQRTAMAKEMQQLIESLPKNLPNRIRPTNKHYKTIQRYKELRQMEEDMEMESFKIFNQICERFKIPYPYSLDKLKAVASGLDFLYCLDTEIVEVLKKPSLKPIPHEQLSQDDLDFCPTHSEWEGKYIDVRIKLDEPLYIIQREIKSLYNTYGQQQGRNRASDKLNEHEVFELHKKGMTAYQIAQKICGNSEPASYNSDVKYTFEAVKRVLRKRTR